MSDIFRQLSELEFNRATVIQPLRLLNFSRLSNINLPAPLALRHAIGANERAPASNKAFRFPSPLVPAESQPVDSPMPSLRQMSLTSAERGPRQMAQPTRLVTEELAFAADEKLAEDTVTVETGRSLPSFAAPFATMSSTAAQTTAIPTATSLHLVSPPPISPSHEVTGGVIQRRAELGITTPQSDRQVAVPELPMLEVDPIQPPIIAATAGCHSAAEVEPPSIAAPTEGMAIDGPAPTRAATAREQITTIESPALTPSLATKVATQELDSSLSQSQPAQPLATFATVSPTGDTQDGDRPGATQTMGLLQSTQSLMENAQISAIEPPSSSPNSATKVTAKALDSPLPHNQLAAPAFAPAQPLATFATVSPTGDTQAGDRPGATQAIGLSQSAQSPMADAQMTALASPSISASLAAMVTPKALDSPLPHGQLAAPAFAPPRPIATFATQSPTGDAQGSDSSDVPQTAGVLQGIQSSVTPQMTVIEPLNAPHALPIAPSVTPNVATLGEKALPSKQAIAAASYPVDLVTASPTLASLDGDNTKSTPASFPDGRMPRLDAPTVTAKPNHEPLVTPFLEPTISAGSQALQTDSVDVEPSPTRALIPTITQEPSATHDVRRKPIMPLPSAPLGRVLPSIDPTPVESISPALRPVTTNVPDARTVSPVIDSVAAQPQWRQLEVMPEMGQDAGIRPLHNEPLTSRTSNDPSNNQHWGESTSLAQLDARSVNPLASLHKGSALVNYSGETQVAPPLSPPFQEVSTPVEHATRIDHAAAGEFPPENVAAEVAAVKPNFAGGEERTNFATMIERGVKREIAQAARPQSESAARRQPEWVEETFGLVKATPWIHPIEPREQPASLPRENITERAPTVQAILSERSTSDVQTGAQNIARPDGEPYIRPLPPQLDQQSSPFQIVETPVRQTMPALSMPDPVMMPSLPVGKKMNEDAPQQVSGALYAGSTRLDLPQAEIAAHPVVASPTDRLRSENSPLIRQGLASPVWPVRSVDLVAIAQNANRVIMPNPIVHGQQSSELAPLGNAVAQVADAPTVATSMRPQVGIFAPLHKQQPPAEPQPLPTIRVTIGRVIVQTTAELSTTPAPQRQPAQPALSLDAYLQPRQREVL